MGWLEGLLTGYVDRSHEIEKQKMEEAVRSQEMEGRVYEHLLSSKDQRLREMAGVGMLDMANPLRKSKGLRGFLGDVDRSPMLPLIRKYMQTEQPYEHEVSPAVPGRTETEQVTIPHTGFPGLPPSPPPPPPPSSAALPDTSPTEAGTPPMTPPPAPPGARALPGPQTQQIDAEALAATPPLYETDQGLTAGQTFKTGVDEVLPTRPPSPPWAPESFPVSHDIPGTPAQTETRYRLPEGFPTVTDQAEFGALGKGRGDYQAAVEMFRRAGDPNPEAAAARFITEKAQGSGFPYQSVPGETTLPDGTRVAVFRAFNKASGQWLDENGQPDPNFRARTAVGTGQWFERAAIAMGYTRGSMVPAADFQRVNQLALQLEQEATTGRVIAGQEGQLQSPVLPEESQRTGAVVGAPRNQQTGQVIPRVPTDQQRLAVGYLNRAQLASLDVSTPDASGTSLEQRIAQQSLLRQFQGGTAVPNVLQTADQQKYRQAQRLFTEARLRKESGAAVPVQELINDSRMFFAIPGDDPQTLIQKARARDQVMDGLAFEAGPAYQEYYGRPYTPKGVPAATGGTAPPPPNVGVPPPMLLPQNPQELRDQQAGGAGGAAGPGAAGAGGAPGGAAAPGQPQAAPPQTTNPPTGRSRAVRRPDGSWAIVRDK